MSRHLFRIKRHGGDGEAVLRQTQAEHQTHPWLASHATATGGKRPRVVYVLEIGQSSLPKKGEKAWPAGVLVYRVYVTRPTGCNPVTVLTRKDLDAGAIRLTRLTETNLIVHWFTEEHGLVNITDCPPLYHATLHHRTTH